MEKTKEYLKMADVTFGEPVTENNGCIFSRDFVAGFHFKSTKHPVKAAHYVSHAINSHDELVNQRNELLKALEAHEKFWTIRESELGELSAEARIVRNAGLAVIAKTKSGAA